MLKLKFMRSWKVGKSRSQRERKGWSYSKNESAEGNKLDSSETPG